MQRKHNAELTSLAKNLREEMTKEERHLWYDFLREYSVRFLRQKVVDGYIVDFYCHQARLIIELDGSRHYTERGAAKDAFRTESLEGRNLLVIRVHNLSVMRNFEGVCEYIDGIVKERTNPPPGCGGILVKRGGSKNNEWSESPSQPSADSRRSGSPESAAFWGMRKGLWVWRVKASLAKGRGTADRRWRDSC